MRVRATQDGHYGGYFRVGPFVSDTGNFEGEVFEIEERLFPVLDIEGNPCFELDEKGSRIIGKDGKPKMKMGSWFAPVWMEQVEASTPITWEYPPFQIPVQYRELKIRKGANKEQLKAGAAAAPNFI
jgi:hypothetical protein